MINMTVRFAASEDKEAWDAFVWLHPEATPYQLFGWKEAVEGAYGHKSCYLLAEEDSKISGVFPLFFFKIPFLSKRIISLPFCDIGDVLADSDETRNVLIKKAISLLYEKKTNGLELRCGQEQFFERHNDSFYVAVKSDKVRMLLDLPVSSEELWKGFKSKLRSQVRKSEKNGLSFRWGDRKDLMTFYQVFSRNMHVLGSPVHSKKWIEKILAGYAENARMGLVFKEDQPVGCGIILFTKHRVSIPWASTLREFNRLSPNMMLYWNLLKYAADSGKEVFDFGRSTLNEGTYRFKKQWGAKPEQLYWYCLSRALSEEGSASDKTRERLERIWQKMPLGVVNFIGPRVRKYISL